VVYVKSYSIVIKQDWSSFSDFHSLQNPFAEMVFPALPRVAEVLAEEQNEGF